MENYEIDEEELSKQLKEDIIKSGEYASVDVLVKTIIDARDLNNTVPMCNVKLYGANPLTVGMLCMALEDMADHIKEEYEHAEEAYKFVKSLRIGHKTVQVQGKEEKND